MIKGANYEQSTNRQYHNLLDCGIHDVLNSIRAATTAGPTISAGLTGERDSRIVMAALASLGLETKIPFRTLNIEQEDVEIAGGLAHFVRGYFDGI